MTELKSANLSISDAKAGLIRLSRRLETVKEFKPEEVNHKNPSAETSKLSAMVDDGLTKTFGADTAEYVRYQKAIRFSWPISRRTTHDKIVESLVRCRGTSISLLESAIGSLEEIIEEASDEARDTSSSAESSNNQALNRYVFIVHGREEGPKEAVARFLTGIGFEPVILHEQANSGQTIIEKFERHSDVSFAVVCMTPDDMGGLQEATKFEPRARQNVIMELGYFIGKLGRQNVCALLSDHLEMPSDILGVVWTDFDKAGAWKTALAKELQAAGHEIDWNTVMRP